MRINMPRRRSEAAVTQFLRDALSVDAMRLCAKRPFRAPHSYEQYTRHCGDGPTDTHHPHHFPVGSGFVASLPRPGGNVTGFTAIEGSLGGKWVELLKEIAPEVARVVLLFTTPVKLRAPQRSPRLD
jgi:hypothetical protein